MADTPDASGAVDALLVKMTQTGRKVEGFNGWGCLAGGGESITSSRSSNA
ncbi:hypothetical protein LMG28727_07338 [Paraburkholderia kirstenboschensis]|nr:hypothetical protein [Paraburkholderia kirstenboschensis]CAD6561093.1 hypothetical protein LMG28727_07338 [Paraburkholderia kirstenboschensis]